MIIFIIALHASMFSTCNSSVNCDAIYKLPTAWHKTFVNLWRRNIGGKMATAIRSDYILLKDFHLNLVLIDLPQWQRQWSYAN